MSLPRQEHEMSCIYVSGVSDLLLQSLPRQENEMSVYMCQGYQICYYSFPIGYCLRYDHVPGRC